MKDYLFIVNIVAGGGRAKSAIPIIDGIMKVESLSYDIIETGFPKEATRIVEDNIGGYKTFVAVGGDGTINEVAQGILRHRRGRLGIIPTGTGNDLARDLGLSLNPKDSLKDMLNGRIRKLDVGRVNQYNFINIASIGYDAEVIKNHNKFKDLVHGKLVYLFSILYTLIGFKSKDMKIKLGNEYFQGRFVLLAVGKGKYYGGGFKILPGADLDDGKLHVCTVSHLNKFKILLLFPSIIFGRHINITKYVNTYRVDEVEIKLEDRACLNIDGEIICGLGEAKFSLEDYEITLIS